VGILDIEVVDNLAGVDLQDHLEDKAVDSVLVDTVLADTVLKQGVPMVHKGEAGHMEVEHWDPVDTEVPHYLDILVE